MCRLANRDYKDPAIGIEIVKILTDPHNAALAIDTPRKSPADSRLAHRMIENMSCDLFHGVASLIVSLTHASMASLISRNRPSKKWSALSMMTSFFGSSKEVTSCSRLARGPN